MASTVLDPIAEKIKLELEGLTGLTGSITVKAYKWAPTDLDKLPAGVVAVPMFERTGVDQPESQLGSDDWVITYPCAIYFDLTDPEFSQGQAVEIAEAFVKAIDANASLTNTVLDSKVVRGEPEVLAEPDRRRALLAYSLDVEVLKLV